MMAFFLTDVLLYLVVMTLTSIDKYVVLKLESRAPKNVMTDSMGNIFVYMYACAV